MAVGGEDREFVAALVSIDFDNVGRWAEKRGITYTTYVELSQKPEIYQLILEDIHDVNSTLPAGGRVRRFVLMHKEFDADEAEMTRTRKLRRRHLADQYQDLIEAMYAGMDTYHVRADVQYRDGRTGAVETVIRIEETTMEKELA